MYIVYSLIVNECTCGFRDYSHVDVNRKIKSHINFHKLNLIGLEKDLNSLGDIIREKYQQVQFPSQELIDNFTRDITNGLYKCCLDNYIRRDIRDNTRRVPTQTNCSSKNYKAIAEAHKLRYMDLENSNLTLANHHKNEWLFYQTVAWENEREELTKFRNEKWSVYAKEDPKELWTILGWKGDIMRKTSCTPYNIKLYFEKKIFNYLKIRNNPKLRNIQDEIENYVKHHDILDKLPDVIELNTAIDKIGKGVSFDGLPGNISQVIPLILRKNILLLFGAQTQNYVVSLLGHF